MAYIILDVFLFIAWTTMFILQLKAKRSKPEVTISCIIAILYGVQLILRLLP